MKSELFRAEEVEKCELDKEDKILIDEEIELSDKDSESEEDNN